MALRAQDAAPPLPDDLGVSYAATFDRLRRMFRGRGLDAEEAADLAQETVVRTLVHLDRHGVRQPDLGPLMGRIAKNLVCERARTRRPYLVALSGAEGVDDPTQDPHEHVARRERQAVVRHALGSLSGRQREALLLSMRGSAPSEIATKLGVERNAADALLHRARRRLAKHLADSRDRLAGFVGVASLRIRSAGRRVSDTASALQPLSIAASQTIGSLITAAVIGAVSLSSSPGDAAPTAEVPSHTQSHATTPASGPADEDSPGPSEPVRVEDGTSLSTTTDLRRHRMGAGAGAQNPATGEEEIVELDVWHERDDRDRGVTGPVLDSGSASLCSVLAPHCDGIGR